MLELFVHIHVLAATLLDRAFPTPATDGSTGASARLHGARGQTTVEYALVLLGAAAIAVLIASWASKSNLIGKLFDFALSKIMGSVK